MNWTPIVSWLSQHGVRILLIVALSLALYYLLRHFVPAVMKRLLTRPSVREALTKRAAKKLEEEVEKRVNTLTSVFVSTGIVFIIICGLFAILAEIGVNISAALAGLGVVGIAVGFGAQTLIRDLIGGSLILMENQYRVGDWVQIAGIGGLVEEINLRRTVVRDFDGTVHSVPNGEIKVASNYTKEWARVNMNISVGYGEDLGHVIEVINRVGTEMAEDPGWAPLILKAPQALRVDAFEDSGIAVRILGETKQMQQWAVMGELRLRLKRAFDEEDIEIPWPHTKLFFGNAPGDAGIKQLAEKKPPAATPTPQPSKRKKHTQLAPEYEAEGEGGDGGG